MCQHGIQTLDPEEGVKERKKERRNLGIDGFVCEITKTRSSNLPSNLTDHGRDDDASKTVDPCSTDEETASNTLLISLWSMRRDGVDDLRRRRQTMRVTMEERESDL